MNRRASPVNDELFVCWDDCLFPNPWENLQPYESENITYPTVRFHL
uniref:Uncharacterized protein n=1 Tax=Onchocerca volvulus TaxID=6282 RepID=A0A8R1TXQ6_ONCVO